MGAQNGEEAFEFDGAALFETRDFRFDPGLECGSLISFAAALAARNILFDLFDKSEVLGEGGEARIRWSVVGFDLSGASGDESGINDIS
jgi:hypothetical protein